MVNYVYQPATLGDFLAIYLHLLLPVTTKKVQGNLIAIYHQETLIGINLFEPKKYFPNLVKGVIRYLSNQQITELQNLIDQAKIPFTLPPFHSGFTVGIVLQIDAHPEADSLWVTQVNIGSKVIQIVTNSTKIKVGVKVVVALPGAMLNDGQVILEDTMLKVNSQGMLTSQKTLGIKPETQVGVWLLSDDAIIGKDFYGQ
jgi:tRNA-binding protein